jgi:hypothetical protein
MKCRTVSHFLQDMVLCFGHIFLVFTWFNRLERRLRDSVFTLHPLTVSLVPLNRFDLCAGVCPAYNHGGAMPLLFARILIVWLDVLFEA